MRPSKKIKFILQVTGLTQEKLAQRLDVSFVTLNSWVNERSIPRKKIQLRIDELYLSLTGERVIADDVIVSKKQFLANKKNAFENPIRKIMSRDDIYKELMISLTYNTNSIEGSTLTESDTSEILFNNSIIANKNLREHIEVKNHQAAFEFLLQYLSVGGTNISEDMILKLHGILMNGLAMDAGSYRRHGVRIVGANVPTANYMKIQTLMTELVEAINKSNKDIISHVANIHARFEAIHPFSDGNGRTGRLLIHMMLLIQNYPPAVILQETKQVYYACLQKAQREGDESLLQDFLCDSVIRGFDMLGN